MKVWCDTLVPIEPGDGITTSTGRRYEVLEQRMQSRGAHAGTRQHLVLRVMFDDEPGRDRVIPIRWYRR